MPLSAPDYSSVTETPGDGISREAAAMMQTRCAVTAWHGRDRDVLELSCGTGQSLGWLARHARSVVGADITLASLRAARAHYGARISVVQSDVQRLPFADGSFDLVSMHESIYYYPDVAWALAETRRVLRLDGTLVVSTINPEWREFNPSLFSTGYLNARMLGEALGAVFPRVEIYFAFPAGNAGLKTRMLGAAKRWAVSNRLIPSTMKGKRLLKRLVFGSLIIVPAEVVTVDDAAPLISIQAAGASPDAFKVIYAVAEC